MILIFPFIEISQKNCVEVVHGLPGLEQVYSIDPVQMAILWRGENAKMIHVVDVDGVQEGRVIHEEVIRKMMNAVDIPIQISGGLRTYDEIKRVLEMGVCRVFVGTAAVQQPGLMEQLVKEFGSRKIAVNILIENDKVVIIGGNVKTDMTPLQLTEKMVRIGISRIMYGERKNGQYSEELPYERLKEIATKTGVRITLRGGIRSYLDLVRLQELEKYGVDSVIIGKPLYENRFPCQALWRLNEIQLTDLGPTRRI
jgi:phosphoribosylformimino-5-aminoimidazole carboxamide ribotide isomerase